MVPIRAILAGVTGRTGRVIARGLKEAQDIELVAGLDQEEGDMGDLLGVERWDIPVYSRLEEVLAGPGARVWVDFSLGKVAGKHALWALEQGMSPVIGATGIPSPEVKALSDRCLELGIGGALIPNFCIGARLMAKMLEEGARVYGKAAIVEIHHDGKLDAPSGTALDLANHLEREGLQDTQIHSVRLPGFLAHHVVMFGSSGESLTLRHDIIGREAFVPGVIMAIRGVQEASRLITDLDDLMV